MELDDLRRQWQQPAPAPPPAFTSQQFATLLKGRTLGLVEKMRRNAQLETGLTAAAGLVMGGSLLAVSGWLLRLYLGIGLALVLGLLYYYYRALATLRPMLDPAGNVRGYLTRLINGLRQLLRFYYRLTVVTGPATLVLGFCYYLGYELVRPGTFRWQWLGLLAGGLLLLGAVVQVGIVRLTRWYLQRLYGQHLDRLESQLRELDEAPAA